MRALVQRVTRASVAVDGREVAAIGPGLLVLLGVAATDDGAVCDWTADKVRSLRLFPEAAADPAGTDGGAAPATEPVGDRGILCVSQFTLYADVRKGTRPSWSRAAPGPVAEPLYERFRARIGALGGVFGADMAVELVNDGPYTVLVEREAPAL